MGRLHVIDQQHAESGTKKETCKQSQEHKHIPQGATLAPPKYKCATKKNMHKQNYELRRKEKRVNSFNAHKPSTTQLPNTQSDGEKGGPSENFGPFIYVKTSFPFPLKMSIHHWPP